jgi:hypothetical protein
VSVLLRLNANFIGVFSALRTSLHSFVQDNHNLDPDKLHILENRNGREARLLCLVLRNEAQPLWYWKIGMVVLESPPMSGLEE